MSFNASTSPASLSYAAATLLCAYIINRSFISPNPPPKDKQADAWLFRTILSYLLTPYAAALALNSLLHVFYTVCRPLAPSPLCPHAAALSPLGWTAASTVGTALILLGGRIRLLAYKQLGSNFTFELATPSGLVTGGLYRHVQHPSYTGAIVVLVGMAFTAMRAGYGVATFFPEVLLPYVEALSTLHVAVVFTVTAFTLPGRIKTEEQIMRKAFGKEWEEYHRKTARLIPFIF